MYHTEEPRNRILEFHSVLTFDKYKPDPKAKRMNPNRLKPACQIFGEQRAMELGLLRNSSEAIKRNTGNSITRRKNHSITVKTSPQNQDVFISANGQPKIKPKINLSKRPMLDKRKLARLINVNLVTDWPNVNLTKIIPAYIMSLCVCVYGLLFLRMPNIVSKRHMMNSFKLHRSKP